MGGVVAGRTVWEFFLATIPAHRAPAGDSAVFEGLLWIGGLVLLILTGGRDPRFSQAVDARFLAGEGFVLYAHRATPSA